MGIICVPDGAQPPPTRPKPDSLTALFARSKGKRILVILETFPFFLTGRLVGMGPGTIAVKAEEGVTIQLVGRVLQILVNSIGAFFIEECGYPIPSISSFATSPPEGTASPTGSALSSDEDVRPRYNLLQLVGQTVLFVLRPDTLSILGQTFRPILVATLEKAAADYARLSTVNVRWSAAPDWIFPTPLIIPNVQMAVFLPFSRDVRLPLTQG